MTNSDNPVIELTQKNFEETIEKGGIVVIDWWASWCAPCKKFAPIFEAAARKYPDIVWAKISTETEEELAHAFDIQSIPTLMIFRDSIIVFAEAGLLPPQALDEIIGEVKKLNMDDVRKKLEEEHAHGECGCGHEHH